MRPGPITAVTEAEPAAGILVTKTIITSFVAPVVSVTLHDAEPEPHALVAEASKAGGAPDPEVKDVVVVLDVVERTRASS